MHPCAPRPEVAVPHAHAQTSWWASGIFYQPTWQEQLGDALVGCTVRIAWALIKTALGDNDDDEDENDEKPHGSMFCVVNPNLDTAFAGLEL